MRKYKFSDIGSKSGARGLRLILVGTVLLAYTACGHKSGRSMGTSGNFTAAKSVLPMQPVVQMEPVTLAVPDATQPTAYKVYKMLDAEITADMGHHEIAASVQIVSSKGKETVELLGKIRDDGSSSLADINPVSPKQQRATGEAQCLDQDECKQIILDVSIKVAGQVVTRQFVTHDLALPQTPQTTAQSGPGTANSKPSSGSTSGTGDATKTQADGQGSAGNSADTDSANEDLAGENELGDYVGAPPNPAMLAQLYDRPLDPNAGDPEPLPADPGTVSPPPAAATVPAVVSGPVTKSRTTGSPVGTAPNSAPVTGTSGGASGNPSTAIKKASPSIVNGNSPATATTGVTNNGAVPGQHAGTAVATTAPTADADTQDPKKTKVKAGAFKAISNWFAKLFTAKVQPAPTKAALPVPRESAPPAEEAPQLPSSPSTEHPPAAPSASLNSGPHPSPALQALANKPTVKTSAPVAPQNQPPVANTQAAPAQPPQPETNQVSPQVTQVAEAQDIPNDLAQAATVDAKLAPYLNLRDGGKALYFYSAIRRINSAGQSVLQPGVLVHGTLLGSWLDTLFAQSLTPTLGSPLAAFKDAYHIYDERRPNHWGTGMMISLLENVSLRIEKKYYPDLTGLKVEIGDIAQQHGAHIPGGHISHENGLDVDIPFIGKTRFENIVVSGHVQEGFDYAKTWQFWRIVESQKILASNGQPESALGRIFVDRAIIAGFCSWAKQNNLLHNKADRDIMTKLRYYPGHKDHFHMRLKCSPYYPGCQNQSPPPPPANPNEC